MSKIGLLKKGNKAVLVTVPHNPLSRGHHATGYSMYIKKSDANKKTEAIADSDRCLARISHETALLHEKLTELTEKYALEIQHRDSI